MPRLAEKAGHPNELIDVIATTNRALLRRMEEVISAEGLTRPQFLALRCVSESAMVPMKDISDRMLVTPANITGIVDRLESKGLVRRAAHRGDRRATIVELTLKGKAMQERLSSRYTEFMEDALRVFTTEEQKKLRNLLLKLQEGMSG